MRRAALIAGLLAALIVGPPVRADTTVDYQGLRIPVPAGWRVVRLGPDSTECLRLDRHAIYLGPAGADQLCPAHAVGRTEALHVEPLADQAGSFVTGLLSEAPARLGDRVTRTLVGPLPGLTVRDTAAREVRVAVPGARALITGSYGSAPRTLDRVLAGVTAVPDPAPDDAERRAVPGGTRRRWVTGEGFDTCAAPSLRAMRAWRDDFVAANIYIGGAARACPDGRLSRGWVSAVRAMGWRLIPTYVGPQAPCTRNHVRFSAGDAAGDGRDAAEDAVRRARALGLPRRTPIYFDLEAYGTHDAGCRRAVLDFIDAWTDRLRALRYTAGVYSSVASGIRDIGRADGISKPPAVWFAHWDDRPGVRDDRFLDDGWWPGHRRIKQYRGDHVERHGGIALNIDSDSVDGYVH